MPGIMLDTGDTETKKKRCHPDSKEARSPLGMTIAAAAKSQSSKNPLLHATEKWKQTEETAQFQQQTEVGLEGREVLMREVSPTKRIFYQLELSHHGVNYFLSLMRPKVALAC